MKIKKVGIDLAKNVFQVHALDEDGKVALRKQLKREKIATLCELAKLPNRNGSLRQRPLLGS